MSEHPAEGQLIWLRCASGAAYDAEVLAVRGDAVILVRPEGYPGFELAQELESLWADGAGMLSRRLRVEADGPYWRAVAVAATGPAQRRAHARIPVSVPVLLVRAGIAAEGILLDMSEAALRMRVRAEDAVPAEGAPVQVEVTLDGDAFALHGHVLRSDEAGHGAELVVVYHDVARATIERLRRALFFEQIRVEVLS